MCLLKLQLSFEWEWQIGSTLKVLLKIVFMKYKFLKGEGEESEP